MRRIVGATWIAISLSATFGRKLKWSLIVYTGIRAPATVYKSGKHKLIDEINDDYACSYTRKKSQETYKLDIQITISWNDVLK